MDTTTHHTMEALFAQLGLPSEPADIEAFVRQHRPLADHLRLFEAPFWTDSQAIFLREQIRLDDDWALLIDTLNAQLRDHTPVDELRQATTADGATDEPASASAPGRDPAATHVVVSGQGTARRA